MIYALPFISALIGWFTNYLAVKMLFWPKEEKKVLFIKLHGVFPKRQKVIAEKIGKMVADELLSTRDLKEKILHPENLVHITKNIEVKIDNYFSETFPSNYPITSIFLTDRRKVRIKEDILVEVEKTAPQLIHDYFSQVEKTLNIEKIITEKVTHLSPGKLEGLIMSILKKEFVFIEWIGAIIGFLIGMVQMLIISIDKS
jgi:uncharacterized membrane protein YheB (UPF0754 family)